MKKRLLVLGAGMLQVPVIIHAREMGYYVIAVDGNPMAPGLKFADKSICDDITSEELMLSRARAEQIDGVIHPCSEVSMHVMGRINDELGLCGISKRQALTATNKHLMRVAFRKANAPSPVSILVTSAEDAWDYFLNKLNRNAILKPSRNSGSRGIGRVFGSISKKEFISRYEIAFKESRDNSVLIEQYIGGNEFSVEVIVWKGNVNVIAVTDKKTTGEPHFVELGHNQPSNFSYDTVASIKKAAIEGVKALGVDNCACHAEIKYDDGKSYLIEIGARMGGDFISTELTHLSTGIDFVGAAINCALGIEPDLTSKSSRNGVCIRYFCPPPGRLISVENKEILKSSNIYSYEIYVKKGDLIPETTSSSSRSGHVIVTTPRLQDAINEAERIVSEVKFVVK